MRLALSSITLSSITLSSITLSSIFVLLLAAATGAAAQDAPPATDIFLADFGTEDGRDGLRNLRRVTDRDGYDNQPAFAVDGRTLYYTSIVHTAGTDAQADTWAYDVATGETTQITDTPESEYSPTPIPGETALSVVRVEMDGSQRLWRVPLSGDAKPSRLLDAIEPVGYHAWLADGTRRELVLFVLDEPHRLVRVTAGDPAAEGRTVASDIGRALHRIPGQKAFSFLHRAGEGKSTVTRLDAQTDELTPLFEALFEREDLAWSPDGWAFMADGKAIFRRRVGDAEWSKFAELSELPGDVSRLAVSPDGKQLALVANR